MHIFGTPKEFEFYKENVFNKITNKPIGLCSDHSGVLVKELFKKVLTEKSIDYIDYGTSLSNDCDYKYFIEQAITSKNDGVSDFIFGFCRTGQGVNMCANKFKGIRSALIYDKNAAEMAVRHNCANFFSFPERLYINEDHSFISEVIDALIDNSFDGGRHQVRIQGLEE